MKFSTTEGMGQVRGSKYDSKECYKKSLKLVKKERKLPHKMEIGKVIVGLIARANLIFFIVDSQLQVAYVLLMIWYLFSSSIRS